MHGSAGNLEPRNWKKSHEVWKPIFESVHVHGGVICVLDMHASNSCDIFPDVLCD